MIELDRTIDGWMMDGWMDREIDWIEWWIEWYTEQLIDKMDDRSIVFDPFTKHDLVLGGKTLVGNHRSQTFLVVAHQVCTNLRRDLVPLPFSDPLRVIEVSRLTFGNSNLQLNSLYGIKVWRLARPLKDLNVLLLEPLLCCLGRVLGHCQAGKYNTYLNH